MSVPSLAAMDLLPALGAVDDAGPVLQVPGAGCLAVSREIVPVMREVASVGVRPEHWLLTPGEGTDGLHAHVDGVQGLGDATLVHCRLRGHDAKRVTVKTAWPGSDKLPRGMRVRLQVRPRDLVLFDAQGRRFGQA